MNHIAKTLLIVSLLLSFAIGCTTTQSTTAKRDVIILLDDGTQTVQISPHPCEGNWNFCDQYQGNGDDLDSFYIPAF